MENEKTNRKEFFLGLILLPVFMGLFFYVLGVFHPTTIKFPRIIDIYIDFFKSFTDKSVLNAILNTLLYVIVSTLISIAIGVFLSFLLNLNKWVWASVEPTIDFLRSIPITFFIPAFAIILGVSSPIIIGVLAIIPSTLIILINVSYGLTQQNKKRLHHYKLLSGKTSRLSLFFKVTIYEILPFFVSGFKIALSYTIVIVTVLEYMKMGNKMGLGELVLNEMENLNYERVYSIIMIVGLIGYILNNTINLTFKKHISDER